MRQVKNISAIKAIFHCDYCEKDVEKWKSNGLKAQSCGCMWHELSARKNRTHGKTNTILFGVWDGIKKRCYSNVNQNYHRYGGRGIKVCDEWKNNFLSFEKWALENGYKKGLSIDRINNDGNYEPSNCRFITVEENSRFKSTTKLNWDKVNKIRTMYASGNYLQKDLASLFDVSHQQITKIIHNQRWVV